MQHKYVLCMSYASQKKQQILGFAKSKQLRLYAEIESMMFRFANPSTCCYFCEAQLSVAFANPISVYFAKPNHLFRQ